MDDVDLLEELIDSLVSEAGVHWRWWRSSGSDLAHHVHGLAEVAEADWAQWAVQGSIGPATVEEIEAALHPITRDEAVELMINLAGDNLVFPGQPCRDRARAKQAAAKAVSIPGPASEWFSNIEGDWKNGRSWSAVTRHTFDGVVAGRGGGFVVALLQIGED